LSQKTNRFTLTTVAVAALILLAANISLMIPLYAERAAAPKGEFPAAPWQPTQLAEQRENIISLTGTGTVKAEPDLAVIQLGVETRASSAGEAQRLNAERMAGVIAALQEVGIGEEDMWTAGFTLTPLTKYPAGGGVAEILGYLCRNSLTVQLDDMEAVGRILDLAVAAGANQISSVYFTLSQDLRKTLQDQATTMAVEDAEAKAQLLAEAAGVQLISPTSLSLSVGYQPEYRVFMEAAVPMPTPAPTPILPGEVEVTVTVYVTYAFQ